MHFGTKRDVLREVSMGLVAAAVVRRVPGLALMGMDLSEVTLM